MMWNGQLVDIHCLQGLNTKAYACCMESPIKDDYTLLSTHYTYQLNKRHDKSVILLQEGDMIEWMNTVLKATDYDNGFQ